MSPRRSTFASAAAILALALPAAALGADGEVTAGTQWWEQSAREAKFEEFRDIPNGPVLESFVLLDGIGGGRYALIGTDAFQNDQAATLLYRRPRWTAGIEYARTPHTYSFVARSPFEETGPGVLVLPDTIQRRVQENPPSQATATLTDLVRTSGRIPLGFRTDRLHGRLKSRLARGIQAEITGIRRQRQGTKAYGGSFGFSNVAEITEPIDQTIAQGEARLSYVRRRVALEAIGGIEAFQNDVDALIFDNPRRYTDSPTAGSSRGRLDLYPDNRTIRGGLRAGLQLPRRTALTAFVGLSETTQDDRWLPFTVNTAILQPDTFPLPGTGTNGKALVFTQDYRLTGLPHRLISGTLRYRRYEYDNQTPVYVLPGQVAYDQTWQPGARETDPIGFTHSVAGLDVDVSPIPRLTLSGTAEHSRRERTHREVARDEEWAFEGKARIRPRSGVQVEGRYRRADRELEHFEDEHYRNAAGSFIEQPTLRRFDVGDRQEESARGSIGWSPSDRIHVSGAYEYLRHLYHDRDLPDLDTPLVPDTSETQLGLLDEARRNISADASIQLTDRVDLYGAYGWVQVYTNQRSRESSTSAIRLDDSTTWQARLKDWFVYANGVVTWQAIPDRVTISGLYEFERSPGQYHLTNFRRTAIDLPTTKYRRQSVGAEGWYRFDSATSVGTRWTWEEFSVNDFATENVPLLFPLTGTANAIFLGDSFQDYRAHVVALLLRHAF